MIRKIIHIDEEKCNGCGLCASACHEGAIDIIDGKARLVRENFCDGFGDCLPNCPTGAITFEEREAPDYDERAVKRMQEEKRSVAMNMTVEEIMKVEDENERRALMTAKLKEEGKTDHPAGCPGSRMMSLKREDADEQETPTVSAARTVSRLNQWPCQIKLLPTQASFFEGAKLLIAADCTAYAYANMHEEFMKGKITVIGCPKLDAVDYTDKLTEIIRGNNIKSVTIVRMEVPCCGGLQKAAENALRASGKFIPWQVVTISRDGHVLE
ncbi:MAG: 4Fe-4S binding protein [Lachnospiraceae bacterium]|nr:4Fe-4S binding protein [Lachnospiraceae bacterium]